MEDSKLIKDKADNIINMLNVAEILNNGQIHSGDVQNIVAYIREFEKTCLESINRADIADSASKKLLKGFEIWKKEHLCIPLIDIENELEEGGTVTSSGKIIVLKKQ